MQAGNIIIPITDTIPTIDTICTPVKEFKQIYKDASRYSYTDSLLRIADNQISELQNKINLLQQKDTATVSGYSKQLKDLLDEKAQYVLEKKEYERLLKWERFKRRFWTGIGVAVIGIIGFLYITK